MSSGRQEAQRPLANGLMLCLRHDAQATEAAALLRVDAGSDAEPPAWPGLAHLLEHLLFTGSRGYQRQQRLINWIPAQGGRLNAVTRSDRTAFFFAVDPPKLEPGLARLTDMLAAPLFSLAALEQEINIIEAEYRLLLTDPDSICEAAQLHLFDGAPALGRFQVGSRAGFGGDLPLLRQALRDFHQDHYLAGNMTLWLQGPQPLAELWDLAGRYGACLPATPTVIPAPATSLSLTARGDAMLRVAGAPRLRLSFALNGRDCDAGWFDMLRTLLTDEADGSLMAWLRGHEWCDGVRLMHGWRGAGAAIVAAEFTLSRADPALGVQVERAFLYWLKRLSALSGQQLRHYVRLARRRFNRQTPLDQLRDLAFDVLVPQRIDTHGWQRWLARFRPEGISRLWLSERVTGTPVQSRGFDLQLAPFNPPAVAPAPTPTLCFYAGNASFPTRPIPQTSSVSHARPMTQPIPDSPSMIQTRFISPVRPASRMPPVSLPIAQGESVRLRQIAAGEAAMLMLYPAPAGGFTELQGHILQAALRATAANLVHGGGELRIERQQGVWMLQLCADDAILPFALEAIIARLRDRPEAAIRQGQRALRHELRRERGQIPVRRLLSLLPGRLGAASKNSASNRLLAAPMHSAAHRLEDIRWQGTLYGGTAGLHQTLLRMLSGFPGTFAAPELPGSATPSDAAPLTAFSGAPVAACYTLTQTEGDNAFILFCPLPAGDIDGQLAWRLMALIYQPVFFQQLRVEQNIGYVANCGFHETAWRSGILFALQSPHLDGEELYRRTLAFLQQMEQRLDEMPANQLAERHATLWRMLTRREPNRFIRARQACFADPALSTPQARERLEHIDPTALKRRHRILTDTARQAVIIAINAVNGRLIANNARRP